MTDQEADDVMTILATRGQYHPNVRMPDMSKIAEDIFEVKKLLALVFNVMDIPIPEEALNGPTN